ncbi:MAG: TIGR04086 family membrane protein [Clostridiaceae bacterium]|jgi:putative membrane protein (TIGR04086 family)|nr:TIGR04086 family membrane protein [Clostridiaceae bacterium]
MINKTGQTAKNIINEHSNIVSMVKGIAIAYLITIPLFVIFAFFLTYMDFPEKFLPSAVIITTLISIIVAGWSSTRKIRNKGWLNGGIVGLMYIGILFLASSLAYRNYSINSHVVVMLVIGAITGSVGGILGINLRNEPKVRIGK